MKYLKLLSLLALLLTLCFSACIKKSATPEADLSAHRTATTPEGVVKEFLDKSSAVKGDEDRAGLQALCIGEMRRTFERMTPEAFRIAYINNNVKVKQLKVLENTTDGDTAKVRYAIEVENSHGTDPTVEAGEREVELTRSQGMWFIETIRPRGSDKIAFTRGMIF